jgi:1-acyl-sn-glycerol-3-phosphate acyltransferase
MKWYQSLTFRSLQATYGIFLKIKYKVKRIHHNKKPKKPFVVLANHSHRSDPFIIGGNVPYTIRYIANAEAVTKAKQFLGKLVGIIPKKKAVIDPKAIKETLRAIKRGDVVGVFPEGDRSWDGETDTIYPNTVKLIRKLKCPLRLIKLAGNYLSGPRWADTKRSGKIVIEYKTVTIEELNKMSDKELNKLIKDYLYQNDVKDPRFKEVTFVGKNLAGGIQFLLWLCPSCMSHDTIYGEGDTIICSHCGKKWDVDGNQRIEPNEEFGSDLKDWFDWQKEQIKQIAETVTNEALTSTKDIRLYNPAKNTESLYEYYADGELFLYKDKMVFKPSDEQKKEEKHFNIKDIEFYVDNFNQTFEFSYVHIDDRYRIVFKGKNSNKWIFFLRHFHQNFSE